MQILGDLIHESLIVLGFLVIAGFIALAVALDFYKNHD